MWIDTHCHLDAAEFGSESGAIVKRAAAQGVSCIVIPAVEQTNFSAVTSLAAQHANCVYALGIHPMYVAQASEDDLVAWRKAVRVALDDPRFVAIGEIGLDFFVPGLNESSLREKQEYFFSEQLKLARDVELPVLLHVRRSQDTVLKYLRRIKLVGGIAHAFNGSFQQAQHFIDCGFKLGFGGAMTFTRALQIRRLATELPQQAIVLETDAPDMAPAWLHFSGSSSAHNSPEQLPRIGAVLAELRGIPVAEVAQFAAGNARAILPRLAHIYAQ